MAARKLPARRRRASKGKAIRISDLVFNHLNVQRQGRSWDVTLRSILALPNRKGEMKPRLEGVLETTTGKFFLKLPNHTWHDVELDAREVAIIAAARRKTKRVSQPVRMREVP